MENSPRSPGRTLAHTSVLLLAFSIPISTALDNVLLALLLLAGLFGYAPEYLRTFRYRPVARASVVLFAGLLLGCAWGAASHMEAFGMLGKYADLAFVPLLMAIFADEELRRRAWQIFLATMAAIALLSWAVSLGVLPLEPWMWDGARLDNPAIFRSSITQNILMGYASYIFVLRAYWAATARKRMIYAALAALTASSILFLVQGRSGYLVLLVTLLWFGFGIVRARARFNARHLGASLLLLPVLLWGIYAAVPRLHQRVDATVTEFQAWYPHSGQATSIGERLEFYYNTGSIVLAHPFLGVGTGGFAAAYAERAGEVGVRATSNPHNEYLNLTVQLGFMGAVLFLYLLYTQWQTAMQLGSRQARDAAAGLVLTLAVTSLVNAPLMDHTEGLFFAYMSALCFAALKRRVHA
jgi:O-antigen ligase